MWGGVAGSSGAAWGRGQWQKKPLFLTVGGKCVHTLVPNKCALFSREAWLQTTGCHA